jgi:hypothetical protein
MYRNWQKGYKGWSGRNLLGFWEIFDLHTSWQPPLPHPFLRSWGLTGDSKHGYTTSSSVTTSSSSSLWLSGFVRSVSTVDRTRPPGPGDTISSFTVAAFRSLHAGDERRRTTCLGLQSVVILVWIYDVSLFQHGKTFGILRPRWMSLSRRLSPNR